jgi:Protein of unknown function (DUF3168)
MPSSALALQQSIFSTLGAHAGVVALLGDARIYDQVPQPATYPYLSFGQSMIRDADTSTEAGDEHMLTLHIWSRAEGRKETHDLIDAVRSALHQQALTLTGHRLVNLRHEFSEARREPDGDTIHGLVRLRAVTEPI